MSSKADFRRLARDSSYNLIRQGWTIIIGMAISILLARALGKEDRGIYTLVILLPQMLISFLNLGIGPATAFYVSRKDHGFHQAVRENIGLTFWISLGTILIGLAIIFLFGDLLFPEVSRNYLLLSLLVVPMSLLVSYLVSIFQGIQDFRLFNLIGMIIQLVMVILAAVLVSSLLVERPFCKYACPYGAVLGVFNLFRIFKIRRSTATCINCKACDRTCPMNIPVSTSGAVRHHQCITCLKCTSEQACPVDKTVELTTIRLETALETPVQEVTS